MNVSKMEEKIGYPQVIARILEIDGRDALVRLQVPWNGDIDEKTGKQLLSAPTLLIIEMWSDATKSVVTSFIGKAPRATEVDFAYSVRYFMNHATDAQLLELIKTRRADLILKYTTGKLDTSVVGKRNEI